MLKKVLGLLIAILMLVQPVYAIAEELGGDLAVQSEGAGGGNAASPTDTATNYTVQFKDWDGTVLAEQQVESGKAAVAPNNPVRDGYRFTGWDVDFSNVTAPLVVTAQYEKLESYSITINYVYAGTAQAARAPFVAQVAKGGSFNQTVNSPLIPGYQADQASVVLVYNNVTADQTVTVTYTAVGNHYTVRHFKQTLNGDYTAAPETETPSAATGNVVTAIAKNYEGFTAPAVMPSGTVAADGSTTLNVYYTRNSYTLYFNTNGSYIAPQVKLYGATI
nr:InlB B-repeat-containing protein [Clostridia bacterium]